MKPLDDHLLEKLSKNSTEITVFDVSHRPLHQDDVKRICQALKHNTHVYSLIANACNITDSGANQIMDLLRHNRSIAHLELAKNHQLSDTTIQRFLCEFKTRFYDGSGYCRLSLNPHRQLKTIEEVDNLSTEKFIHEYYRPQKPVIVRNAMRHKTRILKWSTDYFVHQFGEKKITVKKHDFHTKHIPHYYYRVSAMQMKVKHAAYLFEHLPPEHEFVKKYVMEDTSASLFPTLKDALEFPDFSRPLLTEFSVYRIWFGQKYTHTPLHFDLESTLFTQLSGEKDFLLYAPDNTPYLLPYHPREKDLNSGTNVSQKHQADVIDEFSGIFDHASGLYTRVYPGDILFIPSGWWHEVRGSATPSLSATLRIPREESPIQRISDLMDAEFHANLKPSRVIMKYTNILLKLSRQNEFVHVLNTPLQLAVLYHVTTAVKKLLQHPLTEPDKVSYFCPFTPLFLAIKFGYFDILELLLAHHQTQVNHVFPFLGYTPLTLAAENGHKKIIERLILAGADPTIPDQFGRLILCP